jgi:hypothetical protein
MVDANPDSVDAVARAVNQAWAQAPLDLILLSGTKPYYITAEQCIQRVGNAIATGGWTNA